MRKKRISVILLLCMITTLFGHSVGKPAMAASQSTEVTTPVKSELVEARTANSETFVLPDGSFETVVYSRDKYFTNETGELEEIDDTVIPATFTKDGTAYRFANAADSTKVYFADGNTSKVLLSANGAEIAFSLCGAAYTTAIPGTNLPAVSIAGYSLSGTNGIRYMGVAPDTDVYYSVCHDALKEYIVLRNVSAAGTFSFSVTFSGCRMVVDAEGNVGFVDSATGEEKFRLGSLFAVDSEGICCDDFSYVVSDATEYSATISFTVPRDFLQAAERAYPVLIDPSVLISGSSSTYDTCVDQQYPNSNYYLAESLWTGGQLGNNAMRTLIKFDLPGSISGSQITRATLRIRKRDYQNPTIVAKRITTSWSSSTATWNNQPWVTSAGCSDVCDAVGSSWFSMEVTTITCGWYNGLFSNYGFLLQEETESSASQKTKYYSSDAGYPNRPELVINYVNYIGSRKYQLVPPSMEDQSNCMGYALEKNLYIDSDELLISEANVIGMTKQQLLLYVASKAEDWMDDNINGDYSPISAYDASISTASPGWYRVALRVGFHDVNNNGIIDQGEEWDYHWKYQTSNQHGAWAAKEGGGYSWLDSTSNGLNPAAYVWELEEHVWDYDSDVLYYQIKDTRSVPGWEE